MKLLFKNIFQSVSIIPAIAAIVLCQTGCSQFQGAGEPGNVVPADAFKKMKLEKESDGKRIAVIGTFSVASSNLNIKFGAPTSMGFSDEKGEYIDHFLLDDGKDKNEFFLPTTFTPEDLKIYDNAAKAHPYNEKIKLSFTMKRRADAEPEKNPSTGEYSWEYEQIRIDPAM